MTEFRKRPVFDAAKR